MYETGVQRWWGRCCCPHRRNTARGIFTFFLAAEVDGRSEWKSTVKLCTNPCFRVSRPVPLSKMSYVFGVLPRRKCVLPETSSESRSWKKVTDFITHLLEFQSWPYRACMCCERTPTRIRIIVRKDFTNDNKLLRRIQWLAKVLSRYFYIFMILEGMEFK